VGNGVPIIRRALRRAPGGRGPNAEAPAEPGAAAPGREFRDRPAEESGADGPRRAPRPRVARLLRSGRGQVP